jgi:hypothetical protein
MVRRRKANVQLVTQARPPLSADIAFRQRRYLIMMAIRVVCFVIAVVLFTNGAGWLTAIPAVGAIVIPYFAVVFANGGREPSSQRGFREYEPRLPERFSPPPQEHHPGRAEPANGGSGPNQPGSGPNRPDTDMPGTKGAFADGTNTPSVTAGKRLISKDEPVSMMRGFIVRT